MRRYHFRLERVLRVRRVEEDRTRAELARANAALRSAQHDVEVRLDAYSALPAPAAAPAGEYLAGYTRAQRAAGSVGYAQEVAVTASNVVDAARVDWSTAARRVSSLERLDDRGRERHAIEARRAEDAEADDVVVGRHARRGVR